MQHRSGLLYWLALVGVGVLAGTLSGAFAIGGGIIMVPLLMAITGIDQRRAAATSLVAIIPTAIVGSAAYIANSEIDFIAAGLTTAGAIPGALIGTALLKKLPLRWLQWGFILLLVAIALRMLFLTPQRGSVADLDFVMALGYVLLGLFMGICSGLFGLGGGVIAVPALVSLFAFSDLVAKGTSLLSIIPTSIIGSIRNRKNKLNDIKVGLVVGSAASLSALPGAALAFAMSPRVSAVAFACLLGAIIVHLVAKALRTTDS